MDGKKLYKYILSLPKEKRDELLKREDVRNSFLSNENHYPFVWLIQSLDEDIINFIDNNYLDKILMNDRAIDKITAIMTLENKYATDILLYDKVVNFICQKKSLALYLSNLDYRMGQKIIDISVSSNINNLYCLGFFKTSDQEKIFTNEYIIKLLKCDNIDKRLIINLDGKIINKLILYEKFFHMFLNLSVDEINHLIENQNLIINNRFYKNYDFINKFINVSTNKYRKLINNLNINNSEFAIILEKERLKYVNDKINSINNGIFSDYEDFKKYNMFNIYEKFNFNIASKLSEFYSDDNYDAIYQYLVNLTYKETFEMIIDTFFKDITYNFLINLKTILAYACENKNYVPKNLDLYKQILNFNNLTLEEIKDLFKKYKNIDLASDFYEDYRLARDTSYKSINDVITKFNKEDKYYDQKLSKKYHNEVYKLDGEDFYLYIHASNLGVWKDNIEKISLSLINHDNINYFGSYNKKIIFGFSSLKIENIIHIFNSDSFSNTYNGTDKIQKIVSPNKLMKETLGYNEIIYKEINSNLRPDFIVCFDEITDIEAKIAQEMNLKIILINSKKYKKAKGLVNSLDDRYIDATEADNIDEYKIK